MQSYSFYNDILHFKPDFGFRQIKQASAKLICTQTICIKNISSYGKEFVHLLRKKPPYKLLQGSQRILLFNTHHGRKQRKII